MFQNTVGMPCSRQCATRSRSGPLGALDPVSWYCQASLLPCQADSTSSRSTGVSASCSRQAPGVTATRLELVGPGEHREVIEDHRDPQSGQVGPAIGLLRAGEGQLPLTVERADPVSHAEVRGAPPSLPGAQLRDATGAQMPQTRAQGLERGRRGLRGHRHLRERDRTRPSYEPAPAVRRHGCAPRRVPHRNRPRWDRSEGALGIVSAIVRTTTAPSRPRTRPRSSGGDP